MNPIELFVQGNVVVMLLITLAGAGVVYYAVKLWRSEARSTYVRSLVLTGAVSIIIGMLGQAIGLIQILNVVDGAGHVPATLIRDGIVSTFIPMAYGTFWFLAALAVGYLRSEADQRAASPLVG
jgi:hypothetical protein